MLIRVTRRHLLVCSVILLLHVGTAAAQVGSAQISGDVKDNSGAVVPGAVVSVLNERTGITRSTATNSDGHYVVPGLSPAAYTTPYLWHCFPPTDASDQAAEESSSGESMNYAPGCA